VRRILLLAAALTIPVSGASLALGSGQAWAGTKIVCTTISGNASTQLVISGCSSGHTGGASVPLAGAALASGGTIHWVSGGSTTIAAPVLTATSAKKCPVAGSTADKLTAAVTADAGDGIKVPGVVKGAVCIAPNLNITALKPLKIS
jgi:hypothetical protein